jgi:uncharacterized RDD family membrane protein YckC
MADEKARIGAPYDVKPHAYDPDQNPELFDGVPARRLVAFLIDLVVISIPLVLVAIFIFAVGIVTLGLGFALYGLMPGISVLWALFYYGSTLGSPSSATIGMRAMDIEMRTWYGDPAYFVLGAVHAIVFWVTVSALTPFILLICFFNARKRLLHDFLVGTVIINNPARAQSLAGTLRPTPNV